MQRVTTSRALGRAVTNSYATSKTQPFATINRNRGFFSSARHNSLDPNKEDTDAIDQAKNSDGANPAEQHARASGHLNPKDHNSGNSTAGGGEEGDTSRPGYGEPKGVDNPGLGSKHAQRGEKPGEEAVNPSVKGS